MTLTMRRPVVQEDLLLEQAVLALLQALVLAATALAPVIGQTLAQSALASLATC